MARALPFPSARRPARARLKLMAALLMSASCSATDLPAAPTLDRTGLVQTFSEDFRARPSFYDPASNPRGRWKTNFFFSFQDTRHPRGWEARTLRPDFNLQYYGDPHAGMDPFTWQPGRLTITAGPNPFRADPITHNLPYLSGLISSEKSFNQRYGYFEAKLSMPAGKGLWPAFWLLPSVETVDGRPFIKGQQEVDVFENIGDRNIIWCTVHHDVNGKKVGDGDPVHVDDVEQPHVYGVLISPRWIVWYVDDREVRRRANTDFHRPAFLMLNVAVGGRWPGDPDATTPFPARMTIEWVRAYALKPGQE